MNKTLHEANISQDENLLAVCAIITLILLFCVQNSENRMDAFSIFTLCTRKRIENMGSGKLIFLKWRKHFPLPPLSWLSGNALKLVYICLACPEGMLEVANIVTEKPLPPFCSKPIVFQFVLIFCNFNMFYIYNCFYIHTFYYVVSCSELPQTTMSSI